ncbi:hypothetical protein MON98_12045, partial [Escherichia coli]|nr:hypothetical protein [Escherichia coli]
ADRNRSHWSTSKTPSYTKSVSWHHHQKVLLNYEPVGGDIYSEESVDGHHLKFTVRDEPMITLPRQFASREWYVIKGGMDVSQ